MLDQVQLHVVVDLQPLHRFDEQCRGLDRSIRRGVGDTNHQIRGQSERIQRTATMATVPMMSSSGTTPLGTSSVRMTAYKARDARQPMAMSCVLGHGFGA